jgi:hypothetical protein
MMPRFGERFAAPNDCSSGGGGGGPVSTAVQSWSQEFTIPMGAYQQPCIKGLDKALLLFRRLGVDAPALSQREFTAAYFDLAKRYHPDIGNRNTEQLMANINAARTIILQGYRKE